MTGLSRINFEAFSGKFDFSGYQTLCDVGGATGLLCIEVAKQHAHLRCTSFDPPPVEPIARRHIAEAGFSDQHADRVWRRLRLLGSGLPPVVCRGRFPAL